MDRFRFLSFGILLLSVTLAGTVHRAQKLENVKTLYLSSGAMTTARRGSPIPQLECVGGNMANLAVGIHSVTCHNVGSGRNGPEWQCEADLPLGTKFGEMDVSCEGYSSPHDPMVLEGSCGLRYTLISSATSSYGANHDSSGHTAKPLDLSTTKVLRFSKSRNTVGRRTSPQPQLICKWGDCHQSKHLRSVLCRNTGLDIWGKPKWVCEGSLPSFLRLGRTNIDCEGFESPDDDLVLKGSCSLEYELIQTDDPETTTTTTTTTTDEYYDYGYSDNWSIIFKILMWVFFLYIIWMIIRSLFSCCFRCCFRLRDDVEALPFEDDEYHTDEGETIYIPPQAPDEPVSYPPVYDTTDSFDTESIPRPRRVPRIHRRRRWFRPTYRRSWWSPFYMPRSVYYHHYYTPRWGFGGWPFGGWNRTIHHHHHHSTPRTRTTTRTTTTRQPRRSRTSTSTSTSTSRRSTSSSQTSRSSGRATTSRR